MGAFGGPFWVPFGSPRGRLGPPSGCSWSVLARPWVFKGALGTPLGDPRPLLGCSGGARGCTLSILRGPSLEKRALACTGCAFCKKKKGRSRKGHENKLQRLIGICRLRTTHPTHKNKKCCFMVLTISHLSEILAYIQLHCQRVLKIRFPYTC